MTQDQKQQLEKQLWAVANVLRGKMNADEYKNYILGFIFYKYLSEKLARYIDEKLLVNEKFTFDEIDENSKEGEMIIEEVKNACIDHLGFFLKPTDLFSYLVKKGNGEITGENIFILESLKNVLNSIEQTSMGTASEDDFKGLFDDVDLTSSKLGKSENKKNEVIVEVLTLLSGIDFKLEDSKSDLLGDAYEYLIGEFAAGAGKKGGEFYTPAQVSRLLAKIVTHGKKRIKSVYDPTCGSGSLLLRIGDYTDVKAYYGQELNPTTYNLARMNMILHGVHFDNFSIRQGDTLTDDMHLDLQAEAVVANPPFSADWKGDKDISLANDERYSQYGRLAPKNYADYAFVAHMLHHLADNGTMAVVLPHGVLYRPNAEEHIRKYIIENQNYLDAIIGLPENLFYGTTYSTLIMVFKKCRSEDRDIFMIDASKDFKKGVNQNVLTDKNLESIFNTYVERKDIPKRAYKISMDEIISNDFNLNFPRYIDIFDKEKKVNLYKKANAIRSLKQEEELLSRKLSKILGELNLANPFEDNLIDQIGKTDVRFKNSKGDSYPNWQKFCFHELFNFVSTNSYAKEKLINGSLGAVRNIHYGLIHTELKPQFIAKNTNLPFIDTSEDLARWKEDNYLKEKDIVIADASEDYADIGKAIEVISLNGQKILAGLHTIIARPKTNKISSGFMSIYLQTNLYKDEIKKIAQGTKVLGLPKKYLRNISIMLPTLEEQQKIFQFVTSIEQIVNQIIEIKEKQSQKTKEWKKGLLQQMFV